MPARSSSPTRPARPSALFPTRTSNACCSGSPNSWWSGTANLAPRVRLFYWRSTLRWGMLAPVSSLTHQHVINDIEGLGTDADAAAVGIIHEEQEMDLQSEEHGEKSRHPQVHLEILGLKKPAHGEAEHCSYEDEPPQRPRQMRGYAVQPQAALLDEVVVGAKGLEV